MTDQIRSPLIVNQVIKKYVLSRDLYRPEGAPGPSSGPPPVGLSNFLQVSVRRKWLNPDTSKGMFKGLIPDDTYSVQNMTALLDVAVNTRSRKWINPDTSRGFIPELRVPPGPVPIGKSTIFNGISVPRFRTEIYPSPVGSPQVAIQNVQPPAGTIVGIFSGLSNVDNWIPASTLNSLAAIGVKLTPLGGGHYTVTYTNTLSANQTSGLHDEWYRMS